MTRKFRPVHTLIHAAGLCNIALAFTLPTLAQQMLPAADQSAFNAIGRVNIAGYKSRSMCTGTLIASDRVITAAHCLRGPGGNFADPGEIHFLAGYRQGHMAAHSTGARILVACENAGRNANLTSIQDDLAILELAAPISANLIKPLQLEDQSSPADTYQIIAYRHDRPHIISEQTGCTKIARNDFLLQLSCAVAPGNSGGPVLVQRSDGWRIAAIVSASSPRGALVVLPQTKRLHAIGTAEGDQPQQSD